ncbi:MAG: SMP-30/gluconolactonase/LRE family protein [Alphaproteobacteria bacterium]|nr:SMP-30/gluconolactonase/LRE family protein [Alphaproteobacteria bacterium]
MPAFEAFDPVFSTLLIRHAQLERLYTGCRWAEGAVYFPAARHLIWSDIPNNRMLRYDECDDSVSVFRSPSNNSNGNTLDRQGRLVTAEHGARRVTRTEHDGTITVIADRYQGKRLNSPNDVVVKSDGSIWFTDPPYGILYDYEGGRAPSELGGFFVFRVDGNSGELSIVADDFFRPNGLAFSPDEKILYIADSGSRQPGGARHIRAFDVTEDGKLRNGRLFAECAAGRFDGFRVDEAGRIWSATDDGVHCHTAEGKLIGKIPIPEICANVVFGGLKRNRLFVCATTSLYAVYLAINGVKTF